MKRGCILLVLFFLLSNSAAAISLLSIPVTPSSSLSTCSALKILGYQDISYNYLLRSKFLTGGFYNRLNDITEDGFMLQQAALTFSVIPDMGLGGLFTIIAGQDAYWITPFGMNADVFGSNNVGLTIPEAYLQYSISGYKFYAGELLSLAGIEQYNYGLNEHFSHSILDGFAQTGSNVGLRVSDKYTDSVELFVGVSNGWSTIKQIGNLNTAELGIQYTLPNMFYFMADSYIGIQQHIPSILGGNISNRYLFDAYGTWYTTNQLSFSMNYDHGIQNKALLPNGVFGYANWNALALYANYQLMDQWKTSIRGEIYDDNDGYTTGVRQNWREITLTLTYNATKKLMIRAETRHDFSNVNAFVNSNGFGANNNQQSYAMEAYYSFAI